MVGKRRVADFLPQVRVVGGETGEAEAPSAEGVTDERRAVDCENREAVDQRMPHIARSRALYEEVKDD